MSPIAVTRVIFRRTSADATLELTDRVAGVVLVYGQQLSHIVAITRDQLSIADGITRLALGATHVEVPDPLTGLLARLATDGRR